ncbi:PIG-L family deacetylase [Candidatus Woesearchaeota archaeon]|nr:PIG-L family deacetylase [Candidatus Woesearchaeota archaeon]
MTKNKLKAKTKGSKEGSQGAGSSGKGSILVICAHSDDQVIGPGGAMAKYAKEGYDVHTIVLSFGESVKPHLRREVIAKMRVQESQRANKIIGGKSVTFLGLREMKFEEDYDTRKISNHFYKLLKKLKPRKIFTHSGDDAHPDHRATLRIVLRAYKDLKLTCELYAFEVWHIFNLKKRHKPRLFIDTTDTFSKKIAALKAFKSQIKLSDFYNYLVLNNFFFFIVHIKDYINGLKNHTRYAEVFYKLR